MVTFVNGNAVHPWRVFLCSEVVDSWFSMGLARFVFGGDTPAFASGRAKTTISTVNG
jgi:hypothetical protein